MGANSSTPRTTSINNPTRPTNVILISDEVAKRIDGTRREIDITDSSTSTTTVTSSESFICPKCSAEKNTEKVLTEKFIQKPKVLPSSTSSTSPAPYERICNEMEKETFEKTLEKLDKTIGKPIDWTTEHSIELQAMQIDLLNCFKDNPREPLKCYKNAKNYQNFVFDKQYKTILKHKLGAGDSADK